MVGYVSPGFTCTCDEIVLLVLIMRNHRLLNKTKKKKRREITGLNF